MSILNKCYGDVLNFKDLTTDLISNFKYEITLEHENMLKILQELK